MKKTKKLCPECGKNFFTTAGARRKCYECSPSTSPQKGCENKDQQKEDKKNISKGKQKLNVKKEIQDIIAEEYENKPATAILKMVERRIPVHKSNYTCEYEFEPIDDGGQEDPVNHPSHYTDGGVEVIDFIEHYKFTYHRGNSVKYIARSGKKDEAKEVEDLEKAIWYLKREMAKPFTAPTTNSDDTDYYIKFFEAKKLGYLKCAAIISIIGSSIAKTHEESQKYFKNAITCLTKYVSYLKKVE